MLYQWISQPSLVKTLVKTMLAFAQNPSVIRLLFLPLFPTAVALIPNTEFEPVNGIP